MIDFENEQVCPKPLTFEHFDDPEFVRNANVDEVIALLQGGCSLSRVYLAEEYNISSKNGQVIFEVWHEDTCASRREYEDLPELLCAEGASFDLSLFEIIC